ncbi:MAG: hypothetical protein IIX28_02200, partial [Clostridia bacterium]|nr:hypothetical protein [Clostridia bacterium]
HITPVYRDAMADYEEIEQRVDKIIGAVDKCFNSLNFPRTHLTFVPDEKGDSVRYGKKGNWVIPNLPALSSGEITKQEHSEEWITLGDKVVTPFYEIKFNSDSSIESLYDKELEREWVNGEFNKLKLYKDNPGVYDAWDILPNYTDREVDVKILSADPVAGGSLRASADTIVVQRADFRSVHIQVHHVGAILRDAVFQLIDVLRFSVNIGGVQGKAVVIVPPPRRPNPPLSLRSPPLSLPNPPPSPPIPFPILPLRRPIPCRAKSRYRANNS